MESTATWARSRWNTPACNNASARCASRSSPDAASGDTAMPLLETPSDSQHQRSRSLRWAGLVAASLALLVFVLLFLAPVFEWKLSVGAYEFMGGSVGSWTKMDTPGLSTRGGARWSRSCRLLVPSRTMVLGPVGRPRP